MNDPRLPVDKCLEHLRGVLAEKFGKAEDGYPCSERYFHKDLVTRKETGGVVVYFLPACLAPVIDEFLDRICGPAAVDRPGTLGGPRPDAN